MSKAEKILKEWLEGWNGDTCHFKDHAAHLDLVQSGILAGLEEAAELAIKYEGEIVYDGDDSRYVEADLHTKYGIAESISAKAKEIREGKK